MIGLDTNVLVRYFAKDDPAQARAAITLIHSLSSSEPGWLGLTVLAELVWSLTSTYRMNRAAVAQVLETLLASRDMVIEQDVAVRLALALFRNCRAEFADCLIAVTAQAAGCSKTVTFDRIAARDAGMELLA